MKNNPTVTSRERAEGLFLCLKRKWGRRKSYLQKIPNIPYLEPFTIQPLGKRWRRPRYYVAIHRWKHLVTVLFLTDKIDVSSKKLKNRLQRFFGLHQPVRQYSILIEIYGGKLCPESEAAHYQDTFKYVSHENADTARFFRSLPSLVAKLLAHFSKQGYGSKITTTCSFSSRESSGSIAVLNPL
jgi:hypothetical protein